MPTQSSPARLIGIGLLVLTIAFAIVVLLAVMIGSLNQPAYGQTQAQIDACKADAISLCNASAGSDRAVIYACMKKNKRRLSAGCLREIKGR